MRKIITFSLFCALAAHAYCWDGNIDHFSVTVDSINLVGSESGGVSLLYREFSNTYDASWHISVMCDYEMSSSNYVRFWLMSSDSLFGGEGYFLRIGHTSRNVALYRQDGGGTVRKLCETGSLSAGEWCDIDVSRSALGKWTAAVGEDVMEYDDNKFFASEYMGLSVVYTKTRRNSFHFAGIASDGGVIPDDGETSDATSDKGVLSFSSNVLVPGEEPVVVSYQPPAESPVRIRIFSSEGYMVRTLLDGKEQMMSASIGWDGCDDNSNGCPVGIYVVLAEGQDADGKRVRQKKLLVVAYRR